MSKRVRAEIWKGSKTATSWPVATDPDEAVDPMTHKHEVEQRKWFQGLFVYAATIVVDQLFEDVEQLGQGEPIENTWHLSNLPRSYFPQVTALIAKMMLVAVVDVSHKFVGGWQPPATVAEELAIRLILDEAEFVAELYQVPLDVGFRGDWNELLLEDIDHEWLYEDGLEFLADVGGDVQDWFVPFNSRRHPSPFARDHRRRAIQ